jgi:hypothetical protein
VRRPSRGEELLVTDPPAELSLPRIAEAFNRHNVDYVMIGSMAAVIQGANVFTQDVDVLVQAGKVNLDRAAAALRDLGAREIKDIQHAEGDPPPASGDDLSKRVSMFRTEAGRIDLITQGVVMGSYEDVGPGATGYTIDGEPVFVADLMTVIADKEARDLPRDRRQLPDLYQLADELGFPLKAHQREALERELRGYDQGYER